jgi:glycolate oxidase FAD binding subunit
MDLTPADFAADVGRSGEVTITGAGSRGGPVPGVRTVRAPAGIVAVDPAEMTVCCGAGTPVDDLAAALAEHGQRVVLPAGGTVGGALAVGRSGIRRLGDGPMRDAVLQIRYVSAAGEVVKAGGPTVKNVSGFDLCRLLVGSRGTLGLLAEVILRTRPIARFQEWFAGDGDPWELLAGLYRPVSVLWDGARTWVLLEGHPDDVAGQAAACGLEPTGGPPELPSGGRWSLPPSELASLTGGDAGDPAGTFVAELGVGIVHHRRPAPRRSVDPATRRLHERLKQRFDPDGRLNPGVAVLSDTPG